MKKLIVIAIVAMMITGLAVAANAAVGTVLNIQPNYEGGSWLPMQVGFYSDKGDGTATVNAVDSKDKGIDLPVNDGVLQMYINPLSGLSGTTIGDFRAPDISAYPSQTVTKLWRLNVTMPSNSARVAANYGLTAWFTPGFAPDGVDFFVFEGAPTLTAMKAAATAGMGSGLITKLSKNITVGSEWNSALAWTLPAPTSSTSEDPDTGEVITTWTNPAPMQFTIYAQGASAVPEPGSMLAMFSGLVGLVGFGIRRRK